MISSARPYRLAVGMTLATVVLLVWLSLGVGIVGSSIARLRPLGLAFTLLSMAAVQGLIAVIALVTGWGLPYSGPAEIVFLNGLFIILFTGSAWLFWRAAMTKVCGRPVS